MANKTYQLRYLPIFEVDLLNTVDYIANVLQNVSAADQLILGIFVEKPPLSKIAPSKKI